MSRPVSSGRGRPRSPRTDGAVPTHSSTETPQNDRTKLDSTPFTTTPTTNPNRADAATNREQTDADAFMFAGVNTETTLPFPSNPSATAAAAVGQRKGGDRGTPNTMDPRTASDDTFTQWLVAVVATIPAPTASTDVIRRGGASITLSQQAKSRFLAREALLNTAFTLLQRATDILTRHQHELQKRRRVLKVYHRAVDESVRKRDWNGEHKDSAYQRTMREEKRRPALDKYHVGESTTRKRLDALYFVLARLEEMEGLSRESAGKSLGASVPSSSSRARGNAGLSPEAQREREVLRKRLIFGFPTTMAEDAAEMQAMMRQGDIDADEIRGADSPLNNARAHPHAPRTGHDANGHRRSASLHHLPSALTPSAHVHNPTDAVNATAGQAGAPATSGHRATTMPPSSRRTSAGVRGGGGGGEGAEHTSKPTLRPSPLSGAPLKHAASSFRLDRAMHAATDFGAGAGATDLAGNENELFTLFDDMDDGEEEDDDGEVFGSREDAQGIAAIGSGPRHKEGAASTAAATRRERARQERLRQRVLSTMSKQVKQLEKELVLPRSPAEVKSRLRNELILSFSARILSMRDTSTSHVGGSDDDAVDGGGHGANTTTLTSLAAFYYKQRTSRTDLGAARRSRTSVPTEGPVAAVGASLSGESKPPPSPSSTSPTNAAAAVMAQEDQIEGFVEWYVNEVMDAFAMSQLLELVPPDYLVTTSCRLVYACERAALLRLQTTTSRRSTSNAKGNRGQHQQLSRALPDLAHVMLRAISEGRADAFSLFATASSSVAFTSALSRTRSTLQMFYAALLLGQLEVLARMTSLGFHHPQALHVMLFHQTHWQADDFCREYAARLTRWIYKRTEKQLRRTRSAMRRQRSSSGRQVSTDALTAEEVGTLKAMLALLRDDEAASNKQQATHVRTDGRPTAAEALPSFALGSVQRIRLFLQSRRLCIRDREAQQLAENAEILAALSAARDALLSDRAPDKNADSLGPLGVDSAPSTPAGAVSFANAGRAFRSAMSFRGIDAAFYHPPTHVGRGEAADFAFTAHRKDKAHLPTDDKDDPMAHEDGLGDVTFATLLNTSSLDALTVRRTATSMVPAFSTPQLRRLDATTYAPQQPTITVENQGFRLVQEKEGSTATPRKPAKPASAATSPPSSPSAAAALGAASLRGKDVAGASSTPAGDATGVDAVVFPPLLMRADTCIDPLSLAPPDARAYAFSSTLMEEDEESHNGGEHASGAEAALPSGVGSMGGTSAATRSLSDVSPVTASLRSSVAATNGLLDAASQYRGNPQGALRAYRRALRLEEQARQTLRQNFYYEAHVSLEYLLLMAQHEEEAEGDEEGYRLYEDAAVTERQANVRFSSSSITSDAGDGMRKGFLRPGTVRRLLQQPTANELVVGWCSDKFGAHAESSDVDGTPLSSMNAEQETGMRGKAFGVSLRLVQRRHVLLPQQHNREAPPTTTASAESWDGERGGKPMEELTFVVLCHGSHGYVTPLRRRTSSTSSSKSTPGPAAATAGLDEEDVVLVRVLRGGDDLNDARAAAFRGTNRSFDASHPFASRHSSGTIRSATGTAMDGSTTSAVSRRSVPETVRGQQTDSESDVAANNANDTDEGDDSHSATDASLSDTDPASSEGGSADENTDGSEESSETVFAHHAGKHQAALPMGGSETDSEETDSDASEEGEGDLVTQLQREEARFGAQVRKVVAYPRVHILTATSTGIPSPSPSVKADGLPSPLAETARFRGGVCMHVAKMEDISAISGSSSAGLGRARRGSSHPRAARDEEHNADNGNTLSSCIVPARGAAALYGADALAFGFLYDPSTDRLALSVNGEDLGVIFDAVAVGAPSALATTASAGAPNAYGVAAPSDHRRPRLKANRKSIYPAASLDVTRDVVDCLHASTQPVAYAVTYPSRATQAAPADGQSSRLPHMCMHEGNNDMGSCLLVRELAQVDAATPTGGVVRFAFEPAQMLFYRHLEPSTAASRAAALALPDAAGDVPCAQGEAEGCGRVMPETTPRFLDGSYKLQQTLATLAPFAGATTTVSGRTLATGSSASAQSANVSGAEATSSTGSSSLGAATSGSAFNPLAKAHTATLRTQLMLNQASRGGMADLFFFPPVYIRRRSDDGLASLFSDAPSSRTTAAALGGQPSSSSNGRATGSGGGRAVAIIAEGARLNPLCAAIAARRPDMAFAIASHPLTNFYDVREEAVQARRTALLAACALGYAQVLQVLLERMPVEEILESFAIRVQREALARLRREHRKRNVAALVAYQEALGTGGATGRAAHSSAAGGGDGVGDGDAALLWETRLDVPYALNVAACPSYHTTSGRNAARESGEPSPLLDVKGLYSTHRSECTPLHAVLLGCASHMQQVEDALDLEDSDETSMARSAGHGERVVSRKLKCVTVLLNFLIRVLAPCNRKLRRQLQEQRRRAAKFGAMIVEEDNEKEDAASRATGAMRQNAATSRSAMHALAKDDGDVDDVPIVMPIRTSTLLQDALNLQTRAGESALLMAVRHNNAPVALRLLKLGANPACMDRVTRAFSLEVACANRNLVIATNLLMQEAYRHSTVLLNHAGVATPLCWCALNDMPSMVSRLLRLGADPRLGLEESPALMLAIAFGSEGAAQALLRERRLALSAQEASTTTHTTENSPNRTTTSIPAVPAASGRDPLTVPAAAALLVDVNAADARTHSTALHMACELGQIGVVRALLSMGAAVNATCASTLYTPLHTALAHRQEEAAMALLAFGKDRLRAGDFKREHLLDIAAIDADGDTPLHVAARLGMTQAVEYMLVQYSQEEMRRHQTLYSYDKELPSAPYMVTNKAGRTPLMLAIQASAIETALLMVSLADGPEDSPAATVPDSQAEHPEADKGKAIRDTPAPEDSTAADKAHSFASCGGPVVEGTCMAVLQAASNGLDEVVLAMLVLPKTFPASAGFRETFMKLYNARRAELDKAEGGAPGQEGETAGRSTTPSPGPGPSRTRSVTVESPRKPNRGTAPPSQNTSSATRKGVYEMAVRGGQVRKALRDQQQQRHSASSGESTATSVAHRTTLTKASVTALVVGSGFRRGAAAAALARARSRSQPRPASAVRFPGESGGGDEAPASGAQTGPRRGKRFHESESKTISEANTAKSRPASPPAAGTAPQATSSSPQRRRRSSFVRLLLARGRSDVDPADALRLLLRGFALPELYIMLEEVAAESAIVGIQNATAMVYGESMVGFLEEHCDVPIAMNKVVPFCRNVLKELKPWVVTPLVAGSTPDAPNAAATHGKGDGSSFRETPEWFSRKAEIAATMRKASTLCQDILRVIRLYGRTNGGARAMEEIAALVQSYKSREVAQRQRLEIKRAMEVAAASAGSAEPPSSPATAQGSGTKATTVLTEAHFVSGFGYSALQLCAALGLSGVASFLVREYALDPLYSPSQHHPRHPRCETPPEAAAPSDQPEKKGNASSTAVDTLYAPLLVSSMATATSTRLTDADGATDTKWLWTPFRLAVRARSAATVQVFLEAGCDADYKEPPHVDPLHRTALQELLATHVDVSTVKATTQSGKHAQPPQGPSSGGKRKSRAAGASTHASIAPAAELLVERALLSHGATMSGLFDANGMDAWLLAACAEGKAGPAALRLLLSEYQRRVHRYGKLGFSQGTLLATMASSATALGEAAGGGTLFLAKAHDNAEESHGESGKLAISPLLPMSNRAQKEGAPPPLSAVTSGDASALRLSRPSTTNDKPHSQEEMKLMESAGFLLHIEELRSRYPVLEQLWIAHGYGIPECAVASVAVAQADMNSPSSTATSPMSPRADTGRPTPVAGYTAWQSYGSPLTLGDGATVASSKGASPLDGRRGRKYFGTIDAEKEAFHAPSTHSFEADTVSLPRMLSTVSPLMGPFSKHGGCADGSITSFATEALSPLHQTPRQWERAGTQQRPVPRDGRNAGNGHPREASQRARLRFLQEQRMRERYFLFLLFACAEHNPAQLPRLLDVILRPMLAATASPNTIDGAVAKTDAEQNGAERDRQRPFGRKTLLHKLLLAVHPITGDTLLTFLLKRARGRSVLLGTALSEKDVQDMASRLLVGTSRTNTTLGGADDENTPADTYIGGGSTARLTDETTLLLQQQQRQQQQQQHSERDPLSVPAVRHLIEVSVRLTTMLAAKMAMMEEPQMLDHLLYHMAHDGESALSMAARIGCMPLISFLICPPNPYSLLHKGPTSLPSQVLYTATTKEANAAHAKRDGEEEATKDGATSASGKATSAQAAEPAPWPRAVATPRSERGSLDSATGTDAWTDDSHDDDGFTDGEEEPSFPHRTREELITENLSSTVVRTLLATRVYYAEADTHVLYTLLTCIPDNDERLDFLKWVYPNVHPIPALQLAAENAAAAKHFLATNIAASNAFWGDILYAQFVARLNELPVASATWSTLLKTMLPGAPAVAVYLLKKGSIEMVESAKLQAARREEQRRSRALAQFNLRRQQREQQVESRTSMGANNAREGALSLSSHRGDGRQVTPPQSRTPSPSLQAMALATGSRTTSPTTMPIRSSSPIPALLGVNRESSSATPVPQNASLTERGASSHLTRKPAEKRSARDGKRGGSRSSNWVYITRRIDIFLQLMGLAVAHTLMPQRTTPGAARLHAAAGGSGAKGLGPNKPDAATAPPSLGANGSTSAQSLVVTPPPSPGIANTLLEDVVELAIRFDDVETFQNLVTLTLSDSVLASFTSDTAASVGAGASAMTANNSVSASTSATASAVVHAATLTLNSIRACCPTLLLAFTSGQALTLLSKLQSALWRNLVEDMRVDMLAIAAGSIRVLAKLFVHSTGSEGTGTVEVSGPASLVSVLRYDRIDAETGLPEGTSRAPLGGGTVAVAPMATPAETAGPPATAAAAKKLGRGVPVVKVPKALTAVPRRTSRPASALAAASSHPLPRAGDRESPLSHSATSSTTTVNVPVTAAATAEEEAVFARICVTGGGAGGGNSNATNAHTAHGDASVAKHDAAAYAAPPQPQGVVASKRSVLSAPLLWGVGAATLVTASPPALSLAPAAPPAAASMTAKPTSLLTPTALKQPATLAATAGMSAAATTTTTTRATAIRFVVQGNDKTECAATNRPPPSPPTQTQLTLPPILPPGRPSSAATSMSSATGTRNGPNASRVKVDTSIATGHPGAATAALEGTAEATKTWFMYLLGDWALHATVVLQSPRPSTSTLDVILFLLNRRAPLSVSVLQLFLAASHPMNAIYYTLSPLTDSSTLDHLARHDSKSEVAYTEKRLLTLAFETPAHADTLLHLLVINDQCQLAEYYLAFCLFYFSQLGHGEATLRPGKFGIREDRTGARAGLSSDSAATASGEGMEDDDDEDGVEFAGGDTAATTLSSVHKANHCQSATPVNFLRLMLRRNRHGLTPFDYARSPGMLTLLQSYGCVPPSYRPNPRTFSRALGLPLSSAETSAAAEGKANPATTVRFAEGTTAGVLRGDAGETDERPVSRPFQSSATGLWGGASQKPSGRLGGSPSAATQLSRATAALRGAYPFFPVPRIVLASENFAALQDGDNADSIYRAANALTATMHNTTMSGSNTPGGALSTTSTLPGHADALHGGELGNRGTASLARKRYLREKLALFNLVSSSGGRVHFATTEDKKKSTKPTRGTTTTATTGAGAKATSLSDTALLRNLLASQRTTVSTILPILLNDDVSLLHLGLCAPDDELVLTYGSHTNGDAASGRASLRVGAALSTTSAAGSLHATTRSEGQRPSRAVDAILNATTSSRGGAATVAPLYRKEGARGGGGGGGGGDSAREDAVSGEGQRRPGGDTAEPTSDSSKKDDGTHPALYMSSANAYGTSLLPPLLLGHPSQPLVDGDGDGGAGATETLTLPPPQSHQQQREQPDKRTAGTQRSSTTTTTSRSTRKSNMRSRAASVARTAAAASSTSPSAAPAPPPLSLRDIVKMLERKLFVVFPLSLPPPPPPPPSSVMGTTSTSDGRSKAARATSAGKRKDPRNGAPAVAAYDHLPVDSANIFLHKVATAHALDAEEAAEEAEHPNESALLVAATPMQLAITAGAMKGIPLVGPSSTGSTNSTTNAAGAASSSPAAQQQFQSTWRFGGNPTALATSKMAAADTGNTHGTSVTPPKRLEKNPYGSLMSFASVVSTTRGSSAGTASVKPPPPPPVVVAVAALQPPPFNLSDPAVAAGGAPAMADRLDQWAGEQLAKLARHRLYSRPAASLSQATAAAGLDAAAATAGGTTRLASHGGHSETALGGKMSLSRSSHTEGSAAARRHRTSRSPADQRRAAASSAHAAASGGDAASSDGEDDAADEQTHYLASAAPVGGVATAEQQSLMKLLLRHFSTAPATLPIPTGLGADAVRRKGGRGTGAAAEAKLGPISRLSKDMGLRIEPNYETTDSGVGDAVAAVRQLKSGASGAKYANTL